jgi:hypothetical protein
MLSLKITQAEMQANFEDGRRRHFVKCTYYQMGNYYPILTQIGTQTKRNMLSSNFTIPEV